MQIKGQQWDDETEYLWSFSRPRDVPEYFWAFFTADEIALESCGQVAWRQKWATQVLFTIVSKSLNYLSCEWHSDIHQCFYIIAQTQLYFFLAYCIFNL